MTSIRDNAPRSCLAFLAVAVAVLGFGSRAARAEDGAGIWLYNTDWTANVINLSNYTLKIASSDYNVTEKDGCEPGGAGYQPFYFSKVDPFRSWQEKYTNGCNMTPYTYSGRVSIGFSSGYLQGYKFDVVFVREQCKGLAEHGYWIALEKNAGNWSTASNTKVQNRWATPLGDKKMHNVMTLISNDVMVALYSSNNKDVTLVVQQYKDSKYWDDAKHAVGLQLDFVDNGGKHVP
jgi:hypothetical protein